VTRDIVNLETVATMAINTLLISLVTAATVSAHGHVTGIIANGQYYQGYTPNFKYMNPVPKVPAWSAGGYGQGGIAPDQFGRVSGESLVI
jgi:cellulase